MIRYVKPFLNIVRATSAVIANPPPVYLKLSLRYDFSTGDNASLVSLLSSTFATKIVPPTAAYGIDLSSSRQYIIVY